MSLADSIRADRESPVLSVEHDLEMALHGAIDYECEHPFRAPGWHPSQLYEMCPRFEVLRQLRPDMVGNVRKIVPLTQAIFDVGTAVHRWWQEQYFGPMEVLKGLWECRKCGFTVGPFMPMTPHAQCFETEFIGVNHNSYWRFVEPEILVLEWGIVGHCDGVYVLAKDTAAEEDALLEIKTAGPKFWTGGLRPYPANIYQMNLYMWAKGLKKGILLYVDKGGAGRRKVMCKEFILDYNDVHRKDACDKISAYRDGVENQKLPPRFAVCELTPTAAKPRSCAFTSICLSDKKSGEVEKTWGKVDMI